MAWCNRNSGALVMSIRFKSSAIPVDARSFFQNLILHHMGAPWCPMSRAVGFSHPPETHIGKYGQKGFDNTLKCGQVHFVGLHPGTHDPVFVEAFSTELKIFQGEQICHTGQVGIGGLGDDHVICPCR